MFILDDEATERGQYRCMLSPRGPFLFIHILCNGDPVCREVMITFSRVFILLHVYIGQIDSAFVYRSRIMTLGTQQIVKLVKKDSEELID